MNKSILYFLSFCTIFLTSCYKDTIDEPPFNQDPNIAPTFTIKQLKDLYLSSGQTLLSINQDIIISGIVNGDDKKGNWYKEISIQDSTAGIALSVNQSNLYTDYPVGRRIYVKCKGLAMGMNSGMIVLGGYIDSITDPKNKQLGYFQTDKLNNNVIKGSANNFLKADTVPIFKLDDSYQYKLIAIKDAEFDPSQVGMTYADGINKADASRKIIECSGNSLEVRTSGYSTIAYQTIPKGNGVITGVYTIYKSSFGTVTKQLRLRDEKEVVVKPVKCGSNATLKTMSELRALYKGSATTLGDIKVQGIVISDRIAKNTPTLNLVVQDATGGITFRFASNHTLNVGDEVSINVSGGSLEEFKGLLQVNNVQPILIDVISTGKTVTPRTVLVNEISNNGEAWESTLVKVLNPTLSGAATYGGSLTMSDASGNVTLYTATGSFGATFANTTVKSAPIKSVTGIVSQFNSTRQVQMRNLSDIE